jgi:hypothetical protein
MLPQVSALCKHLLIIFTATVPALRQWNKGRIGRRSRRRIAAEAALLSCLFPALCVPSFAELMRQFLMRAWQLNLDAVPRALSLRLRQPHQHGCEPLPHRGEREFLDDPY